MYSLYHCIDARSFRPLWTLEELQLPYALHMLPFPPRALQKSYRELNPLGTVPLLVDGENRMTESAAICQYLAARHSPRSLNVEPDEADFASYLNCLHYGEATLTFPQTLVLRYRYFEPQASRQDKVAADYEVWFLARLKYIEHRLVNRVWLCADRFTAADISVGYALLLASHLGLQEHFGSHTRDYWVRLQNRAGFQRAKMAQNQFAEQQGVPLTPAPLVGR